MGRREGGGKWVHSTQKRSEARIEAHRESGERHLSTGGGSKQSFLPEPCLTMWGCSSNQHTHRDYWQPESSVEEHTSEYCSVGSGLQWLVSYSCSAVPQEKAIVSSHPERGQLSSPVRGAAAPSSSSQCQASSSPWEIKELSSGWQEAHRVL